MAPLFLSSLILLVDLHCDSLEHYVESLLNVPLYSFKLMYSCTLRCLLSFWGNKVVYSTCYCRLERLLTVYLKAC